MKKLLFNTIVLFVGYASFAQVGINNTSPQATLDISASNVVAPANTDGILIPRMDDFPVSNPGAAQDGMMVFITGAGTPAKGFYYWDNASSSWSNFEGIKNTLDQAYDQGGAGNGRTITADNGVLSVQGVDGFENTGTFGTGASIGTPGAGSRLFYNPNKSAFRAGTVSGTQWDDINVGEYSAALGLDNISSGNLSFSMGLGNSATAESAVAFGSLNTSSGQESVTFGNQNTASGLRSAAFGSQSLATSDYAFAVGESAEATAINSIALGNGSIANADDAVAIGKTSEASFSEAVAIAGGNASGANSISIGRETYALSYGEIALGIYNRGYVPNSTTAIDSDDRLLSVGNGISNGNRNNALTLLKNGYLGLNTDTPRNPLEIDFSTPFDLSYLNTGQDGIFIVGEGDNSGVNAIGGSISFGPPSSTRGNQRKSAIASVQTSGDVDHTGLAFYVHGNPVNMSPMVEGMRLTHNRRLGINNTSPSATLDISANSTPSNTNGILIPRINNFPSPTPTAAQDGMMVFVTGAGTPAKGFYYWDDNTTSWTPVAGSGSSDIDWYEEGTTSAPNAITDDIFTQGNVAIGKTTANYPLDIEKTGTDSDPILGSFTDSSTGTGTHTGVLASMTGTHNESIYGINASVNNSGSGLHYGVFSNVGTNASTGNKAAYRGSVRGLGANTGISVDVQDTGSASAATQAGASVGVSQPSSQISYGLFSNLNASGTNATGTKYGFYNLVTGGTGTHYGIYNDIRGTDSNTKYGTYNLFGIGSTNTGGILYGSYNSFGTSITSTSAKYGSYTEIPSSLAGTHYGVYSDVQNSSGYAGYFLGRVSLGETSGSRYLMPDGDGTAGQVMTTDGSGNVTWQAAGSSGTTFSLTKVHLTSNQTYSGSGQDIMDFDNVLIDLNSDFDTSTNRFVASQAGYYRITASYSTTATNATNDRFGLNIWINNTFAKYNIYTHHGSGIIVRQVSHIAQLAIGDYIDIRMFGESGFAASQSNLYTTFEIERIR